MQFRWKAIYDDGECLDQLRFNSEGGVVKENKYPDIDRSRLKQFQLLRSDGTPHVIVNIKPNQQLIYRRRGFIRSHFIFGQGTPEEHEKLMASLKPSRETIWLVGWHENRNGVNVQMITVTFEDGHIEVLDRWDEEYAPYCAPILIPEEELEKAS